MVGSLHKRGAGFFRQRFSVAAQDSCASIVAIGQGRKLVATSPRGGYIAPMTIRPILIHPDPRLKKVCAPVAEVDDKVRALIDDMIETMYDAPGLGLAAPQIGVLKRIFVMDCDWKETPEERSAGDPPIETGGGRNPVAFVNPEILESAETLREHEEGCLSIPDIYSTLSRPEKVRIRYLNRDGAPEEAEFEGLAATCVQHEMDHLNGKLFIDYLGQVKRAMITRKMQKLKRERGLA